MNELAGKLIIFPHIYIFLITIMFYIYHILCIKKYAITITKELIWVFISTLFGACLIVLYNNYFVSDLISTLMYFGVNIFLLCLLSLIFIFYIFGPKLIDYNINYDFITVTLLSLLGVAINIAAYEFISFYVSLELLSLSNIGLILFYNKEKNIHFLAIKYLLLSALFSVILLYGISLIYGAMGSMNMSNIQAIIGSSQQVNILLYIGMVMVVLAVISKLALVPVHAWMINIYSKLPRLIFYYLIITIKLALMFALIKLLWLVFSNIPQLWMPIIEIISFASIIFSYLACLLTNSFNKLIIYMLVASLGNFLLLLLDIGNYYSVELYIITFLILILSLIYILAQLKLIHKDFKILELKGIYQKYKLLTVALIIVLLGLVGFPPFLSFWYKLSIFDYLISHNHITLVVLLACSSVLGYIAILKNISIIMLPSESNHISIVKNKFVNISLLLLIIINILGVFIINWVGALFD